MHSTLASTSSLKWPKGRHFVFSHFSEWNSRITALLKLQETAGEAMFYIVCLLQKRSLRRVVLLELTQFLAKRVWIPGEESRRFHDPMPALLEWVSNFFWSQNYRSSSFSLYPRLTRSIPLIVRHSLSCWIVFQTLLTKHQWRWRTLAELLDYCFLLLTNLEKSGILFYEKISYYWIIWLK